MRFAEKSGHPSLGSANFLVLSRLQQSRSRNAPPGPKGSKPPAASEPVIKQPGQASRPPQSPSAGDNRCLARTPGPVDTGDLTIPQVRAGAPDGPGGWKQVGSRGADPGRATSVSSPYGGVLAVPSLGPREEDPAQHPALRVALAPGASCASGTRSHLPARAVALPSVPCLPWKEFLGFGREMPQVRKTPPRVTPRVKPPGQSPARPPRRGN